MAPVVHGLEQKYSSQIEFIYLDAVDSSTRELRSRLNYRSYPTFILLDGEGNEVKRWVGRVEQSDFIVVLDDMLARG
jgi:thioredoxin-related protein